MVFRNIIRWFLVGILVAGGIATSQEQKQHLNLKERLPFIPPRSPQESLKAFKPRPGYQVQLVASEPLLGSPVSMDFDEDGRLYVAEYPEYNAYAKSDFKLTGRVRLLEDENDDGVFDKGTIFADGLPWGATVFCYDGGVMVGAAPDIWFLNDTNGDGKADIKKKILTGFGRDHAGEAMLNSFRWGLDNRIHVSTGMAGGEVRNPDDTKGVAVEVRNHRILIDPRNMTFVKSSGGGQHGFTMDDYGRGFVCSNSNPAQVLAFDTRYLARNPFLPVNSPAVNIAPGDKFTRIYRISPDEPWRIVRTDLRTKGIVKGSNEGGKVSGFFTGATGITSYRGDALPDKIRGDLFVGEVSGNLIYQAKVVEKGVVPEAIRAEPEVEFLASEDNWFRPVQMAHGPDGCLYVVDMYRGLIEGAAFLPPEVLKHIDVMAGFDRGRIWRIAPEKFQRRPTQKLSKATSTQLVALLEHPNGWHRDTASRLLFQKQDKSIEKDLLKLAATSQSHLGKMHALWALEGLGLLKPELVLQALVENEPRLRQQAALLFEKLSQEYQKQLAPAVAKLLEDSDPRVRLQAIYSLGNQADLNIASQLSKAVKSNASDSWFRQAILSCHPALTEMIFNRLVEDSGFRTSTLGTGLLASQAKVLSVCGLPTATTSLMKALDSLPETEKTLSNQIVRDLIESPQRFSWTGKASNLLEVMLQDAVKTLKQPKATPQAHVAALKTISFQDFSKGRELFQEALASNRGNQVHLGALEALGRYANPEAAQLIVESWAGLGPQARSTALEVLLSRPAFTALLLDALEARKIPRAEVDMERLKLAASSKNVALSERLKNLTASSASNRLEVFQKYKPSLTMNSDKAKGKAVFKSQCSACHQLEGVGYSIGADLLAARNRGMESILLNILDPNREVKPAYITYIITTNSGKTVTGMIASESANSITLRKTDNQNETILRNNIDEMRSTGISFMPEGLEKQITVEAMADLLAYLDSIR